MHARKPFSNMKPKLHPALERRLPLNITLPTSLREQLVHQAELEQRSMSMVIERCLRRYLKEIKPEL
jgi:hypothetical protein